MKQKISLFATLFLSLIAAQFAKAQTPVPEPLYMSKTATALDNDRMKLTMESFVEGNNVASDIAVVMDLSATMNEVARQFIRQDNYLTVETKAPTVHTQDWTYSNTSGDYRYFYLLNGVYYPVKRSNTMPNGSGSNNIRALWIDTPDGRKYLKGDSLADDYVNTINSNTTTIFTGTLYNGGWSYSGLNYGNETGNAAQQWYYKYTDDEYYPVRRSNAGGIFSMWIEVSGTRYYLSANGLSSSSDPNINDTNQIIYFGTLYKGWTQGAVGTHYYYKEGENYYLVNSVTVNGFRQLSVVINGETRYLNGTSVTTETNPYASGYTNTSLYFRELYHLEQPTGGKKKLKFMEEAVWALLDQLHSDAIADQLHHRVSLIQFNNPNWTSGHGNTLDKPYLMPSPISNYESHLLIDFKDITTNENLTTLKQAMIVPEEVHTSSHYEYGMSLARGLFHRELSESGSDIDGNGSIDTYETPTLTGEDHSNYSSRPRVVIIVGDCQASNPSSAENLATQLKGAPYNALVFVVYVNDPDNATYMGYAKKWAEPRTDRITVLADFNETMIPAFERLAREIREALIVLDNTTVVKDVIAEGFEISDPVSDIKVYTADYATGFKKNDMTFAARVDASGTLTPTVTTDGSGRQVVSISGFDFSENFCGTVGGTPLGKKLILEIMVDRTTAVGGTSIFTNAPGSGMYDELGNPIAEFVNPVLSIPVNIQIQKNGLTKGESAVFTVRPIDALGVPIPSVNPIRVILTGNASGTPVSSTVKGLDQTYNWLVTEEGWSWNYEVNGGNPSLSTATQLLNPFVFTNVKQSTTVKAAESKVTNDFSTKSSTTVNSR